MFARVRCIMQDYDGISYFIIIIIHYFSLFFESSYFNVGFIYNQRILGVVVWKKQLK